MNTRKLAIFCDLAETQNYSRTAERMFLTQSSISKHIMSLEKEWNVKLFIRVHRQVKLTSAGKLLLPKVKDILKESDELQQSINDQIWLTDRPLIIQGLASFSQYQASKMMVELTKEYPQIKIKFSEASVDHLEHALDQKNVDIVFTRIFHNTFPNYNILNNENDQMVVLINKDNPLAQQSSIELNDLTGQSLLLQKDSFSKSNPVYSTIQDLFSKSQITYSGQQMGLILEMINQNEGVSIAMEKSVDLFKYQNIKVVPLIPHAENTLVFMKQKDNTSAVVSLFWKFLIKQTGIYFNN